MRDRTQALQQRIGLGAGQVARPHEAGEVDAVARAIEQRRERRFRVWLHQRGELFEPRRPRATAWPAKRIDHVATPERAVSGRVADDEPVAVQRTDRPFEDQLGKALASRFYRPA